MLTPPSEKTIKNAKSSRLERISQELIGLLLLHPHLVANTLAHIQPEMLENRDASTLYKSLVIYYTSSNENSLSADFAQFSQSFRAALTGQKAENLITLLDVCELYAQEEYKALSTEEVTSILLGLIKEVRRIYIKKQITALQSKISEIEKSSLALPMKQQQLNELSIQFIKLTDTLTHLK